MWVLTIIVCSANNQPFGLLSVTSAWSHDFSFFIDRMDDSNSGELIILLLFGLSNSTTEHIKRIG